MRLHDVQVILSATNTADKIQHINQQQGQVAQSQNAMQLENQVNVKLTQTQQNEHKSSSKTIGDKEKRGRNPGKNNQAGSQLEAGSLGQEDKGKLPATPSGNIIDIKI